MAYEKKDGDGVLFKNDRKEKDTHADYRGNILINGQEYWLNAWIKEGAKGKFFSLSAKPKQPKAQPSTEEYVPKYGPSGTFGNNAEDMDYDPGDDIPF